ncbi:MAG TPA: MogA/MoaB family molybdenum cofactor biosynthesis protein [Pyrinomonadaceae bacterium]|nr:MogA/MoaB family molybdenum cofactor biosynthesis protein [Pyrinomonadaceae bacterium]
MADHPIRALVISVSDTRREEDDVSGVTLVGLLIAMGAEVHDKVIISDDLDDIRNTLYVASERADVNLIITTGGTGFAHRDNTPEATQAVIEREAPGIAEAIRRETSKNTPLAMLSRGICGIRDHTLIINLPGSPTAVKECFEIIKPVLQHAINLIKGETGH